MDLCREMTGQVLRALEVAHGANVLHRDISPDALMLELRRDGRNHCRLTGFGLAKHLGDEEDDPTAITMTGQVVGNPAYMAPETILQGLLDERTDLYALGVTIYEALTGHRPFPGRSLSDMLAAHVQGRPDPVSRYRPNVPADFRQFIDRMIQREPEQRFQNASQALASLDREPTQDIWSLGQPEAPRKKQKRTEDWSIYLLSVGVIVLALILLLD
jgi:serine/threonine protein kinase